MEHEHRDRSPETRRARGMREAEADAWFLMQSGIDQAHDHRRDIDEMTARIIAFNLASGLTGNLAFFAQTGGRGPHADNTALRAEYLPIYHDPGTPEGICQLIDWLGSYLVRRENPTPEPYEQPEGAPLLRNLLWHTRLPVRDEILDLYVRADQPVEVVDALADTLAPLIEREGDPFRAFLTLPGVDATSPDLEESFFDSYRGSFTGRDAATRGLVELDEIESGMKRLADDYAGGEFVYLDRDGLWERLHDVFEIVALNGEYHAFDK